MGGHLCKRVCYRPACTSDAVDIVAERRLGQPGGKARVEKKEPIGQGDQAASEPARRALPDRIQRELDDVAADDQLGCCTVTSCKQLPNHDIVDIEIFVRPEQGGAATLRICFPKEYPFRPCMVDAVDVCGLDRRIGSCGALNAGALVTKDDSTWGPVYTLACVLKAIVKRMEVSVESYSLFSSLRKALGSVLEGPLSVVYISVGCGGPFLDQQFPRPVQRLHACGQASNLLECGQGRCVLVLVDPLMTHPEKPPNRWVIEHCEAGRVTVCACNAQVRSTDMSGLEAFIMVVSDAGVSPERIIIHDHRGAAYSGASFPLVRHFAPEVALKCRDGELRHDADDGSDVSVDAISELVLRVVHGVSREAPGYEELSRLMARRGSNISLLKLLQSTPKESWPPNWNEQEVEVLLQMDRQRTMARLQGTFPGGSLTRGLLSEARQYLRPLR